MTEWGLYVELQPYRCEGMVRLAELPGDYFVYEPAQFHVRGKRTGKTYKMGQSIEVIIKKSDIAKRQIDLKMA